MSKLASFRAIPFIGFLNITYPIIIESNEGPCKLQIGNYYTSSFIEGLVILRYVKSTEDNDHEKYEALDLDDPPGLLVLYIDKELTIKNHKSCNHQSNLHQTCQCQFY